MLKIEFEKLDQGVIEIGGRLFLKTPEAKKYLMALLGQKGYTITDLRDNRRHGSVQDFESHVIPMMNAVAPVLACYDCEKCEYVNQRASQEAICEACGYRFDWRTSSALSSHIKYLYEDVVYEEKDLPLRRWWEIFEGWHWAPLHSSPTLHEKLFDIFGLIHDKGWFIQDGRKNFSERTWADMGKIIRHFTTLEADRWDDVSRWFALDGPGGIDCVAKFCHQAPAVTNKPYFENFLHAHGKALEGKRLSEQELDSAVRGLEDQHFMKK